MTVDEFSCIWPWEWWLLLSSHVSQETEEHIKPFLHPTDRSMIAGVKLTLTAASVPAHVHGGGRCHWVRRGGQLGRRGDWWWGRRRVMRCSSGGGRGGGVVWRGSRGRWSCCKQGRAAGRGSNRLHKPLLRGSGSMPLELESSVLVPIVYKKANWHHRLDDSNNLQYSFPKKTMKNCC